MSCSLHKIRLKCRACVYSTNYYRFKKKLTFTRSASDNGLVETSLFRSWVTKSITGSGSMKAVEDISATQYVIQLDEYNRFQNSLEERRYTTSNKTPKFMNSIIIHFRYKWVTLSLQTSSAPC